MYPDAGAGKDTRDTFRELVKVYPVKNCGDIVVSMGATDVTSEIMRLKQLKPDIIYLHGYVASVNYFMAFMKDAESYYRKLSSGERG